jgi:hypothetical protein
MDCLVTRCQSLNHHPQLPISSNEVNFPGPISMNNPDKILGDQNRAVARFEIYLYCCDLAGARRHTQKLIPGTEVSIFLK